MKKIFVAVMAMAAFAACSNEEQIAAPKGQEIAFGDAFVDNATKAIYEGDTKLKEFYVWGNVTGNDNTVQLYENAKVYTSNDNPYGTVYNCDVKRYWTPSCDYDFVAIAHAKSVTLGADFLPTTITYEANGNDDLLLSEVVEASTNQECVITGANNGVVAFTMKHLLSRVAVKFTNKSASADYTYTVKDIQISNAYASGDYTIASEKWNGTGAMTTPLTFSAITTAIAQNATVAATGAYVIIPGTPALSISFTAEVVFGGKVISTKTYTKTLNADAESTADDFTFANNTAYSFNVELPTPGEEIKFSITTVDKFGTGSDVNVQ